MSDGKVEKLWELIKDCKFAMLTSEDGGQLRARPMVASQSSFDGTLWFFTRAGAHKVKEVQQDERVGVTYADPGRQDFVSMSGTASLVTDRGAIEEHWSEALRTWFPKGKDDPEVALLKVHVTQAEYWDAPNSTMLHAYGYVKAALTGEPPHPSGNEKVTLAAEGQGGL